MGGWPRLTSVSPTPGRTFGHPAPRRKASLAFSNSAGQSGLRRDRGKRRASQGLASPAGRGQGGQATVNGNHKEGGGGGRREREVMGKVQSPPSPPPDTDRAREKATLQPRGAAAGTRALPRSGFRASSSSSSCSPFVASRCPGNGVTPRALSTATAPASQRVDGAQAHLGQERRCPVFRSLTLRGQRPLLQLRGEAT
ncbi:uncharacterized protein LOC144456512 [Phascolarctos cinereus]